MKAFVAKIFLVLLPVTGMVAANVTLDPQHLVHEGSERSAAQMLASGRAVAGLLNFDERLLVKYYVELQTARLDVAVIGSSRAMQIGADDFPHRSFFNSSVSAAEIEDLIAITGEYARHQRLPRHVFIGLDPWLLNGNADHDGWRSLASSYRLMLKEMGLPPEDVPPPSLERFGALISPAYFQQLLRTVKSDGGLASGPRQPRDNAEAAVMPDGSRRYPLSVRARTPQQTRQMAIAAAAAPTDLYAAGSRGLDRWSQARLEGLVAFLQSHETTVTFLLAPYHPALASRRRLADVQMITATERYYRDLAAERQIDVLGAYDAAASGCSEADLYDESHPRPSCMEKILALGSQVTNSMDQSRR